MLVEEAMLIYTVLSEAMAAVVERDAEYQEHLEGSLANAERPHLARIAELEETVRQLQAVLRSPPPPPTTSPPVGMSPSPVQ
jgi:hypothetical protein